MSILRTRVRDTVFEDDGDGLLDRELGALDEIREIGLEERQRRAVARGGGTGLRRRAVECCTQSLEQLDALGIEGQPLAPRTSRRRLQAIGLRIEERPDHPVEGGEFLLPVESRGKTAGFVAQPVELVLAGAAQKVFEMRLDFFLGKRARNRSTASASRKVVEKRTGRRGEPEHAHERQVGWLRRRTASRSQDEPRQSNVALAMLGDEKDRAVLGRRSFQGRAVGDKRVGEIAGDDRPKIAPYDDFGSAGQNLGYKAARRVS